jgi:pimeloyl-ACP methyl ester carboxylesterase
VKKIILILLFSILCFSCQKEEITFSADASDVFYVDNNGASMRVMVSGNTLSNTYLIVIHGGPGAGAFFYDTPYINSTLGSKYALVYWDQRNAGASQGNVNGSRLNLRQMSDDLVKVIEVLKYRYGKNISLFLLAHSFGGMIAADFLTKNDNQNMLKGYINLDASHNYPLNDTLTRQKLLIESGYQLSLSSSKGSWKQIFDYCNSHKGNFTFEQSQQLEAYAGDAENLIDSIKHVNIVSEVMKYAIRDKYPLTAMLTNLLYSEDSEFNRELAVTEYSSALYSVKIPVLLLWGRYDFTCPPELGEDFLKRIGSTDKEIMTSEKSGHNMIIQDPEFLCDRIDKFLNSHK